MLLTGCCRNGGINASRIISSTAWAAFSFTASFLLALTKVTDCSTRSRTILSTSRPTYPTSVNFEASTLTKGASAIFASLRAISVLPTPVAPIMRMLFGTISFWISDLTCILRQRFLNAMATFRLASY